MNCASHPGVETNLRCSKCGKPICPKCLVQTPVGARCADCARLARLPTFHVSARYYLRAIGTAAGMAIICGVCWGFLNLFISRFYNISFILLLAPAAGFAIGEVTSIAVNRKRGKGLAAISGIAVLASFLITIPFPGGFHFSLFNMIYTLLALGLGIFVTITRLH